MARVILQVIYRIISVFILLVISFFAFGQGYKAVKTINRQTKKITAIATSNSYFATASADNSLIVWDYNGKKAFRYDVSEGSLGPLCFIPDSNLLLVAVKEFDSRGFERPIIKCFNMTGKLKREFIDTTLIQTEIDAYYQKNTIGVQKAKLNLIDAFPAANKNMEAKIPKVKSGLSHIENIQSIVLSPNQKFVASIDHFKILKVWDIGGKIVKSFQVRNDKLRTPIYFTSDSTLLVSPDNILNFKSEELSKVGNFDNYKAAFLNDRIYYHYDYNEPSEAEKLVDLNTNSVKDMAFEKMFSISVSTSKDKFALLGIDGLIRIRNLDGDLLSFFGKDRSEFTTFRGKQIVLNSKINTISFAENSIYLISGDKEGRVVIWKTE